MSEQPKYNNESIEMIEHASDLAIKEVKRLRELVAKQQLQILQFKDLREELAEVEYRLEMAEDILGRSDWITIYREVIE